MREQAEAALGSDAILVANAVNAWNTKRLSDVETAAALPSIRAVLELGEAAPVDSTQAAQEVITALMASGRAMAGRSFISGASTEEMAAQASQVALAIGNIADVRREQHTASEAVRESAEEMRAQIEQLSVQATELASTAAELRRVVAHFSIGARVPELRVLPRAA